MSVATEQPDQPEVIALIAELDDYQDSLYPPEARYALDIASLKQSDVVFAVARDDTGNAVGCGAVVVSPGHCELKRMFVRPSHRGHGFAHQVLAHLEAAARQLGCHSVLLETGPYQPEALAFYGKHGYARRSAFGSYREHPLSVFMEKRLRQN